MNSKALYILFILIIFSCKKEEETLNYTERFEIETYDLINDAFVPLIEEREKLNPKFNKSKRQIFESPYSFHPKDKLIFNNIIPKEYLSKIDTVLIIKKWESNKLNNFNLIGEHVLRDIHQIYSKDNFELYMKTWRKEIGDSYVLLSNPIFNDEFNKAFVYSRIDDYGDCGLNSSGFHIFSKESGNWKMTKDLLRPDKSKNYCQQHL